MNLLRCRSFELTSSSCDRGPLFHHRKFWGKVSWSTFNGAFAKSPRWFRSQVYDFGRSWFPTNVSCFHSSILFMEWGVWVEKTLSGFQLLCHYQLVSIFKSNWLFFRIFHWIKNGWYTLILIENGERYDFCLMLSSQLIRFLLRLGKEEQSVVKTCSIKSL